MDLVVELFLVLAAIYASECTLAVRRGGVVLESAWGGRARRREPLPLLHGGESGLLLANPVPLGARWEAHPWPVAFGPDGVELGGAHVPWAAAGAARAQDGELRAGGASVRVPPHVARACALWLRTAALLAPQEREAELARRLDAHCDERAAAELVARFARRTLAVRGLALGLFAFVFVVAPIACATRGLAATWPALAAGVGVLLALTLVAWACAHRALFPGERGERVRACAGMLLNPSAAMRGPDQLSRALLADLHPLAAAHATATPAELRALARRTLLELDHPRPVELRADAGAATRTWFRVRLRASLAALLERAGVDVAELLLAPAPLDDDCRVRCPRCDAQFVRAVERCDECDVALVPFAPPTESLATAA